MHSALNDLKLDLITLVIPGQADFYLHEKIRACGLEKLIEEYR